MRLLYFLFLLFSFLTHAVTYGQTEKKITYSQLAEDIFFSGKDTLSYNNIHFINDLPEKGAETFITTYTDSGAPETIYGGFKNYLISKGAKKDSTGRFFSNCESILFEGCTFDNDIRFSNVNFNGEVIFINNIFPTMSEDFVGLYGQTFGGAILIDSCRIKHFEVLFREEIQYRFFLKFNHSVANTFFIELQKSTTQLKGSKILTDGTYIQIHGESDLDIDSCSLGKLYLDLDNIYFFKVINSKFTNSKDEFSVLYAYAKYVTLLNNNFNTDVGIMLDKGYVYIDKNKFQKKLAFDFNQLDKTSYVNLASLNNLDFGIIQDGKYYDATTQEQIKDDIGYKIFLRINKSFYDHFKNVGDFESANKVYVKIREIENIKLNIIYNSAPSFKSFFDLNLNRLLKYYTNYGTDPANALVVSFYIILAFGFFYFLFPSEWDISSKSKLIKNFKDFIEKNDKGYLYPFLTLIVGFLISIANATALSLNAFTTLGFGNIPTKGVARYICIIQGFIGWFLLSIFTVALINQAQF